MAGLTGFVSHKEARQKELIQKILQGMTKAVLIVERQAKINANFTQGYQTGGILNAITNEVEQARNDITGIVKVNKDYAPFVEHGTVNMAAQPFLFPALESSKSAIAEALKNA